MLSLSMNWLTTFAFDENSTDSVSQFHFLQSCSGHIGVMRTKHYTSMNSGSELTFLLCFTAFHPVFLSPLSKPYQFPAQQPQYRTLSQCSAKLCACQKHWRSRPRTLSSCRLQSYVLSGKQINSPLRNIPHNPCQWQGPNHKVNFFDISMHFCLTAFSVTKRLFVQSHALGLRWVRQSRALLHLRLFFYVIAVPPLQVRRYKTLHRTMKYQSRRSHKIFR